MRPAGKLLNLLLIAFVVSAISACSQDSAPDPQQELASRALVPEDSDLAAIYNRSCRNCHTVAGTGAPLTGDAATWSQRIKEKGMPVLVDNVVNGFGGMPPFGLCMDCDSEQFEALIKFMAKAP
jgi:cytochrome c5